MYDMFKGSQRLPRWRFVPIIGWGVWEVLRWRMEIQEPLLGSASHVKGFDPLSPYIIDMSSKMGPRPIDESGILCCTPDTYPDPYHPTEIAQYALAHWNAYRSTGSDEHRQIFLTQANWFLTHEYLVGPDMSGWPIPFPWPEWDTPASWLSALTQGNVISVLVRAYRLTGDLAFLDAARRATRTFEVDILDGGVSTPVGDDGVFFEEVAVYPAGHILNGFILSLFGLYDYVDLTGDARIVALISRAHRALHTLIEEFDCGYWSRYDLRYRRLARRFYHALHVTCLHAHAQVSGCDHCAAVATRWAAYQRRPGTLLRYFLASRRDRYWRALWRQLRRLVFRSSGCDEQTGRDRICVPVAAFPVAGGTRGVLAGIARAMANEWQIDYLTHYAGPNRQGLTIHNFGPTKAHPWQFPNVWLYALTGWWKLLWLLREGRKYRLILPQDGVFSGAFSAVAAKIAGIRIVCMDHGNVTLPGSSAYRAERLKVLATRPLWSRLLSRLRYAWYWPSLRLLAWVGTRFSDHFLPAGDDVAEVYTHHYGIHPSRITRFPFMIDVHRFTRRDDATRACLRAEQGLPMDAIVVTMINRLAIEKGLHIAIQGLSEALMALPPHLRSRVHMRIIGDGSLRPQVEADIDRHSLRGICTLHGEATPDEVSELLGTTDVFLYTGTRGINPVAVLEAMAAGCAVIASTAPQMVAQYLADGRGIAIPVGDVDATAAALIKTITDLPRCQQMGTAARVYIAKHHTAEALRRALLRATFWVPDLSGISSGRLVTERDAHDHEDAHDKDWSSECNDSR
jgi:glycosyltransferase involved in cell wall biosynthesis